MTFSRRGAVIFVCSRAKAGRSRGALSLDMRDSNPLGSELAGITPAGIKFFSPASRFV